jgi:peptide/nickel transport system substrate-binding protein
VDLAPLTRGHRRDTALAPRILRYDASRNVTTLIRSFAVSAAALAFVTCGDRPSTSPTGGTIVVGVRAAPERIHPAFAISTTERLVVDVMYERLARLGPDLDPANEAGFVKELATAWQWSTDSSSVTFTLDPAARWHDGQPVRAHDIAFSFAFVTDPVVGSPLRRELAGVDSVVANDSLTVTAWFNTRSSVRFHDLVVELVPFPAHVWAARPREVASTDSLLRRPVGNGRFVFTGSFDPQELVLVADSTHPRGRPRVDRLIVRTAPDPATNLARLRTGEVHVLDQLAPDAVLAIAADTTLVVRSGTAFDYGYLQFNLWVGCTDAPHPFLGDVTVRQALTRGTSRAAIVRAVYDTFAVVAAGPFVRQQFGADDAQQAPEDPAAAAAMLEAAGWRRGAEGLRERDGVPLRLRVLVPTSAAPRIKIAEVLQEQWRAIGVDLQIDLLEPATMGERMRQRDFEAVIASIRTSVTPTGLRQSWGGAGAQPGGRNAGRYRNAAFDAQVDSAFATPQAATARTHFSRAYATLLADAPAIFLYEASTIVAMDRRITAPPIRGDAWWFDLASWGLTDAPAAR